MIVMAHLGGEQPIQALLVAGETLSVAARAPRGSRSRGCRPGRTGMSCSNRRASRAQVLEHGPASLRPELAASASV
jgi:hypothetical protein